MWSWWAKEGGGARGKGLGRKVPNKFLKPSLFICFCLVPSSMQRSNPSLQVQHDLRGDECQGQHRGGTGNHFSISHHCTPSCIPFCLLSMTYIWAAGFPWAGGPSVTKPRHLEPRPRTRQRCSFSGSASYFGVSKHLPKWFGSLSFNFQASTKKNLQSAALLWNLNRCILAVFIYFCIFPNNKIH